MRGGLGGDGLGGSVDEFGLDLGDGEGEVVVSGGVIVEAGLRGRERAEMKPG